MEPEKKIPTSAGMETATQTVDRIKKQLQPTVSANEIANPPAKVTPPVPQVNTNDGSRTNNLIETTATNTQGFIQSESENAQKRDELATLLGTQTFDAAGERQKLTGEYGVADNMTRLQDIQTQLAKRNTQTELNKAQATEGGAGAIQAQRAITLADKQAAIRDAGLAAEANVLKGSIETAQTIINSAMEDYYSDRQLDNQNKINQLNYFSGLAEGETKQMLQREQRVYEEDQANIKRAQSMVDSAVTSGFLSGSELQNVLNAKDPVAQAELAQTITARGIQKQIADAKAEAAAKAANKGFSTPDVKNFGTNDAPLWRQWNSTTGQWEDVADVSGNQVVQETQQSLDQLSFLRDTTARILGNGEYEPLYEASGPSGIGKFLGDTFVGDTDYRRLETYADTLRTNVLALMTDPSVKKFFGPQMSNADVKLMSATGSSIRPESNSPEEMKAEAQRLDDLLNRMETAVKKGVSGSATTQGPVQSQTPINIITAPDGLQIEIID